MASFTCVAEHTCAVAERLLCCSDSTLLMADCFQVLRRLKRLVHLSLSRCYQIHLAALT